MADYAISNVPRRVVFAASGVGPYAFTFEILAQTDIAVYRDDTLLTLTTDYTVLINSNGTGSITLVASPVGATQIAIVGARNIQRTTDFTTGGDFFANTVNDELDSLTIFAQQNAEGLSRALSAPQTDPTNIDMTLPRAADRANKFLAFDASGNPVPGAVPPEIQQVLAIEDEIVAVAAIDTEITTVAGIDSDVTTVAGIAGNVTTVAGIAANVTTVAGDAVDIGIVAADLSGPDTIGVVAGISTEVAAVAAIDTEVVAVAGDAVDIGIVAGEITPVNNIATVAGVATDIATVAGIAADVTTVAADGTDIGVVAGISADIQAVAPIAANVTTVAGIASDVTAVAADATDIGTVAANITNVNTVAGISANVTTVAGIDTEITALAGKTTEIDALYAELDDIGTKVTKTSDTGAAIMPAGTDAERPTPVAGHLRFNTDSDEFEGYNGTAWASVGGSAITNDTTTSTDVYPAFLSATSGTAANIYTSNAKLLYNPSTGEFKSPELVATNGIVVNSQTVSADYTIPSGSNAMSVDATIASGVTVTVSSGSTWVIL